MACAVPNFYERVLIAKVATVKKVDRNFSALELCNSRNSFSSNRKSERKNLEID